MKIRSILQTNFWEKFWAFNKDIMKYPFLYERKPNPQSYHDTMVYYLFFFNFDLSYSTNFGGIQQFINNRIFYAGRPKDGCLFWEKILVSMSNYDDGPSKSVGQRPIKSLSSVRPSVRH